MHAAALNLAVCAVALFWSAVTAEARGVRPTVCNTTDGVVLVAMVDSDLRSSRAVTADVYKEDGWWHVDAGDCRRLPELSIGWRAFAFAALQDGLIKPFIYTPSRERQGSTPPRFKSLCANSIGKSFSRNDLLESEVGRNCGGSADVVVPVSFKVEVGVFTDVALTINIDETPGLIDIPMSPTAKAAVQTAQSLLVFEEIGKCALAAAPSVAGANFTSDQVKFDAGRLYALFKATVSARLSSNELDYQKEYICRNFRQAMIWRLDMTFLSDDGRHYTLFLHDEDTGVERVDNLGRFTIPESDAVYAPGTVLLGLAETDPPVPITQNNQGLKTLTAHDPKYVTPIVRVGLPAWALLSYADAVLAREPVLQTCIDRVYLANRGVKRVNYTGCLTDASGARLLEILADADATYGFDREKIVKQADTPVAVENVNIAAWEGYIDTCVPVLVDRYARSTEGAIFECTCFAAAADLAVEDRYLKYEHGASFNIDYDALPTEQKDRYSSLRRTCTDRYMRTNREFDSVVSKLAAPRIAAFLEPTEDIVLAEYLGLKANYNGRGPLKIISITSATPLNYAKVGEIIRSVDGKEVRNLSELHTEIEAARAAGKTSVSLSMKSNRGYYLQELNL